MESLKFKFFATLLFLAMTGAPAIDHGCRDIYTGQAVPCRPPITFSPPPTCTPAPASPDMPSDNFNPETWKFDQVTC